MKKIIITLLSFAFLFIMAPQNAKALDFQAGDLIKEPTNKAVYYFGYDGKRHAFPNQETYFSWYRDFKRVKTINKKDLIALPLGKNIVVRAGTYLVRFKNSPKVYAVEPLGRLKHIISPDIAKGLYGDKWQERIIVLPEYLFSDYSEEGMLIHKKHPTGTIIKYEGDNSYNLMTNNYTRNLGQNPKWDNYHFNQKFVVSVDHNLINYESGYDIVSFKASLADTAQTLIEEEEVDYFYYIKIDPGANNIIQSRAKGKGIGLTGYYYDGPYFDGTPLKRVDSQIDFNWGLDSPMKNLGGSFSVKWQGKIEIPSSGNWDFYTLTDDGIRLTIDDKLIIDNFTDHREKWDHANVYLSGGFHDIELKYYDAGYDAVMKLFWKNKSTPVPSQYLYNR